ncbi:TIR domain-containing protein [Spirosoma sp. SC4-14]|uniref:TIR domain-containing protein n=1 Tax=Spirosoma sp. SC4-14 TaxID=3128900 RepID=UPI0030CD8B62
MARKVFFSFHYTRDSHRVAQIRNCNAVSQHFERTPFLDRAQWESIKRQGVAAIQKWINDNMNGTSVVVLCFGLETYKRPWVIYELEKAHREGRGIVAIDMSGMNNMLNQYDGPGPNPLVYAKDALGNRLSSHAKYITYHWGRDNGRLYIDNWIEKAAQLAGR